MFKLQQSHISSSKQNVSLAAALHSGRCRPSEVRLLNAAGRSCPADGGVPASVCPASSVSSFCSLIGWFADRQVDKDPLVGDGGQVGEVLCADW